MPAYILPNPDSVWWFRGRKAVAHHGDAFAFSMLVFGPMKAGECDWLPHPHMYRTSKGVSFIWSWLWFHSSITIAWRGEQTLVSDNGGKIHRGRGSWPGWFRSVTCKASDGIIRIGSSYLALGWDEEVPFSLRPRTYVVESDVDITNRACVDFGVAWLGVALGTCLNWGVPDDP